MAGMSAGFGTCCTLSSGCRGFIGPVPPPLLMWHLHSTIEGVQVYHLPADLPKDLTNILFLLEVMVLF